MRTIGRTSTAVRWGVAGVLALAIVGGPSARGAALRWKFQPGETLHYVMDQKTTTSVKGGPQDLKTTVTQTIDMDWAVKGVDSGGTASMTQTITRVRTKIDSAFGAFEYDSKDPKEPQGPAAAGLVPMLKALVGAEFSFKMNPRGELSDVNVPEKVVEALRQAGPAGGAGGMFSAEGLKNMISESSLAMPDKDLAKGEGWSRQTKIPTPPLGAMTLDKKYTYQGPEPKDGKTLERIELDTTIAIETAPNANIDAKIKSQDGKGNFFFDGQAGRITESTVSEKIEMVFKIMNTEITQGNDTSTTMKLVK